MTITFRDYKIETDANCYVVIKIMTKENGEKYESTLAYPSSLERCIQIITDNIVNSKKKTVELNEFLDEYRSIKNEITEAVQV